MSAILSSLAGSAIELGTLAAANPVTTVTTAIATGLVLERCLSRKPAGVAGIPLIKHATTVKLVRGPELPAKNVLVKNRRTVQNEVIRNKRMLVTFLQGAALTIAGLLTFGHVVMGASLAVSIFFSAWCLISFLSSIPLANHYSMNDFTKARKLDKEGKEVDQNDPVNRSNLRNSLSYTASVIFAPIWGTALAYNAVLEKGQKLLDEAEYN